jgi:formylglycine-generating enzyme required for sulfatase activity
MRGGVAVEQILVPAGSFMMGSEEGSGNERPVHLVTLDAFWIDRTEVTNAQFAEFVAETDYVTTAEREGTVQNWQHPQGEGSDLSGLDQHPVVNVSWEDAAAFAEWARGRLPTEAQWEYAARGPEVPTWPWGDETPTCELLNYAGCVGDTSEAGAYLNGASWVGALDMAGNVSEWVNDWYAGDYYQISPGENPPGPGSGVFKALRGGSGFNHVLSSRAAFRYFHNPDYRHPSIGFRVAELLSDPDS